MWWFYVICCWCVVVDIVIDVVIDVVVDVVLGVHVVDVVVIILMFLLLLQINVLSVVCREGTKDKYVPTVDLIIGAARQIREEVGGVWEWEWVWPVFE